jgi:hypothetical protein
MVKAEFELKPPPARAFQLTRKANTVEAALARILKEYPNHFIKLAGVQEVPGEQGELLKPTEGMLPARTPEELIAERARIEEALPGDEHEVARTDAIARLWGFTEEHAKQATAEDGWPNYIPLFSSDSLEAPHLRRDGGSDNRIVLAESPGGLWTYGLHVTVGSSGKGYEPNVDGPPFVTRADALRAAIAGFRETVEELLKGPGEVTKRSHQDAKKLGAWLDELENGLKAEESNREGS